MSRCLNLNPVTVLHPLTATAFKKETKTLFPPIASHRIDKTILKRFINVFVYIITLFLLQLINKSELVTTNLVERCRVLIQFRFRLFAFTHSRSSSWHGVAWCGVSLCCYSALIYSDKLGGIFIDLPRERNGGTLWKKVFLSSPPSPSLRCALFALQFD